MRAADLLKRIKARARVNKKNRRDPRFLNTMGFLVAKGFLTVNYKLARLPNQRLQIDDAIWAGKNVEPRILEVLPAAVLRLGNHFDFDAEKHKSLARPLAQLRSAAVEGDDFLEIPYQKIRQWCDLALPDGRTKPLAEKKITKTFRLRPEVIERLTKMAEEQGRTVTDCLEERILAKS